MSCRICHRCGRCGRVPVAPICAAGTATLPPLVPRNGLGAAVDLGTTTVVVRVYDLASGRLVRDASSFNPQRRFAADVMGRISCAMDGHLAELRDEIRATVWDCCGPDRVSEAVVVGNTTMLHLFAGLSPASYAVAPFEADRLFGERRTIDGVDVRLPRCAHAFFGADAVAAVRMAGLCARTDCALLADIGTNGEIALWRGDRQELSVASVAAGPAFERAGIVGSALVAAIADGLDAGAIDVTGLACGTLADGVTQEDVRAVQIAKAAVFAGLETLLRKTGTELGEIGRFVLAGGFGSGLDPAKAARIGLFDRQLLPTVEVGGNLAVEGAGAALFDPAFGDETDALAARAKHVELGGDEDFAAAFIREMRFPADLLR